MMMRSITYLDPDYPDGLNARGIKTHLFNPMKPQLAMQMNNRDHRKILVIDGKWLLQVDVTLVMNTSILKKVWILERYGYYDQWRSG